MLTVRTVPVQVYLIAPPLVCWGLERLVHTAVPRLELIGACGSLSECLPQLERHLPDVVVLDFDDGYTVETLAEMCESTRVKLVVVTSSFDNALLDRAVLAGVRGVVRKRDAPSILLKAIEQVNDGELWVDPGAADRIFARVTRPQSGTARDADHSKISSLTLRERQTIAALASDASAPAKVIAGRLCISEHTLRNHLTSIYAKLGLANRLDLYAYATRHSLNKTLF